MAPNWHCLSYDSELLWSNSVARSNHTLSTQDIPSYYTKPQTSASIIHKVATRHNLVFLLLPCILWTQQDNLCTCRSSWYFIWFLWFSSSFIICPWLRRCTRGDCQCRGRSAQILCFTYRLVEIEADLCAYWPKHSEQYPLDAFLIDTQHDWGLLPDMSLLVQNRLDTNCGCTDRSPCRSCPVLYHDESGSSNERNVLYWSSDQLVTRQFLD